MVCYADTQGMVDTFWGVHEGKEERESELDSSLNMLKATTSILTLKNDNDHLLSVKSK